MKMRNWFVLFFCLMVANGALALGIGYDESVIIKPHKCWIERLKDFFHNHHQCRHHWH